MLGLDTLADRRESVTAAGIALDKPFLEHTWEESRRVLEVNVSLDEYGTQQILTSG